MVRVGFVCVYHYSNKIRPQGYNCLIKFIESLNKNCSYDFTIYIIDNQSEKIPNIVNTIDNIIYTRIDDQYINGLTGAWNLGIKQSYENKDDLIFALNDDLSFNHTINNYPAINENLFLHTKYTGCSPELRLVPEQDWNLRLSLISNPMLQNYLYQTNRIE